MWGSECVRAQWDLYKEGQVVGFAGPMEMANAVVVLANIAKLILQSKAITESVFRHPEADPRAERWTDKSRCARV